MSAHPFKKTCPCTILSPPFFNFSDSPPPPPLGQVIKIYFPPLKRGGSELCYVNNDHGNVIKFMKITSNLHNTKSVEPPKTSFPKKSVENADLYKPVLNKIMTTHK